LPAGPGVLPSERGCTTTHIAIICQRIADVYQFQAQLKQKHSYQQYFWDHFILSAAGCKKLN